MKTSGAWNIDMTHNYKYEGMREEDRNSLISTKRAKETDLGYERRIADTTKPDIDTILDAISKRAEGLAYHASRKLAQADVTAMVKAVRRASEAFQRLKEPYIGSFQSNPGSNPRCISEAAERDIASILSGKDGET